MALGGVTASLAVVILSLGGLVPLATYILPMICCVLLQMIRKGLGRRGCWVWYATVSMLGILLGADKEAAAVFLVLGYYPIIKPQIERKPAPFLAKLLLFNLSILLMYQALIHLFGMAALAAEFSSMGLWMTLVTLALGNLCFFLLDRVLSLYAKKQ